MKVKLIINHTMCESEVLKNILPLEKVLQFTYSLQVYEEFTNFVELPKDILKNVLLKKIKRNSVKISKRE